MNSDMTVHTAVAFQNIWPVSDLVPHKEVAQIGIEKIRFHVVGAVHTVMTKTDLSHVSKKNRNWASFTCSVNVAYAELTSNGIHVRVRHMRNGKTRDTKSGKRWCWFFIWRLDGRVEWCSNLFRASFWCWRALNQWKIILPLKCPTCLG